MAGGKIASREDSMGSLGCADGREWVFALGMDAARGYSGAYLVWRERRIGVIAYFKGGRVFFAILLVVN